MNFFAPLTSALARLGSDASVNLGTELEALKASEAAFEANVQSQVEAAIDAKLKSMGFDPEALAAAQADIADLKTRVATVEGSAPKTAGSSLAVVTASLPDATVGVEYSQTIEVSGGKGPYTYASTKIPKGLWLTDNVISGKAIAAGDSAVTVTVTDADGAKATAALPLTVKPA